MSTLDPERVIHLLREHLAAHDKRLAFLFGAGTSSAINVAPIPESGKKRGYDPLVPAVKRMTELCKSAVAAISEPHAAAWEMLVSECESLGESSNIEAILGRLRLKLDAAGPAEMTLGLTGQQLIELETAIRGKIADLASPDESRIPTSTPHDQFARWIKQARRQHAIEIFTTNYDVLIERSLELARVPFFDGFIGSYKPYFSPDAIDVDNSLPGRKWTRLWKLHGSTNWSLENNIATRQSVVGMGDMILPSHRKYDESRKMPYLALMDRLTTCVSADGMILVTAGYSWNDQHINSTILTALDSHSGNAVVALSYAELDTLPELVQLAEARSNFILIAPSEGILGGKRGSWALTKPISGATASFLDLFFDSDAVPGDSTAVIPGKMRLGDFNVFSDFLARMNFGEDQ
jgi:hypothetical protein